LELIDQDPVSKEHVLRGVFHDEERSGRRWSAEGMPDVKKRQKKARGLESLVDVKAEAEVEVEANKETDRERVQEQTEEV
jgi:hypothetical protein